MNITVRLATAKDAELIADLSRQTFFDTFAAENSKEDMALFLDTQFTREALIEEVTVPGNIFYLAYAAGEAAGYMRLREEAQKIEIARLYAATKFIGKGAGKVLMQTAIDLARQQQKKYIYLGVWEKNSRAIKFYKQWGFEKISMHTFVLGTDVQQDWLMEKRL